MHQTTLQRIDGGLGTVTSPHLVENSADVNANGLFCDAKLFRDFTVAAALGDTGKHFSLARREINRGHTLSHAIEGHMRQISQSAIDSLDGVEKLFSAGVFREVPH